MKDSINALLRRPDTDKVCVEMWIIDVVAGSRKLSVVIAIIVVVIIIVLVVVRRSEGLLREK